MVSVEAAAASTRTVGLLRMLRGQAALVMTGMLIGCAAGPDFAPPPEPTISAYTETAVPHATASAAIPLGGEQRFVSTSALQENWWQSLGSIKLDALIEQAFRRSPTLEAAEAKLRQAQHLQQARAGSNRYPQVDATIGAQRQRQNPAALGVAGEPREFALYDAGIGVRYQLDLAGGNRRALEALAARVDYQRYALEAARIDLAAAIVNTAVTQARLAGQIESTQAIVALYDEQLSLTKERVRLGHASAVDLLAMETQAAQSRAELPLLHKQHEQTVHQMAVLSGTAPALATLPRFTLSDFQLPNGLPVMLPSELVRRRPDIQAAEALLHAANAEYGVAVSKLYPQMSLSAKLGSQTLSSAALFGAGSAVWSVLGQLTQPLFNPALSSEKRASLAALDAAAANYRSVVLESFRNVADVLRAVEHDSEAMASLATADSAASASARLVSQRYALGAASYVDTLVALQQAKQVRLSLVGAQAQRLLNTVLLFQAMGGQSFIGKQT